MVTATSTDTHIDYAQLWAAVYWKSVRLGGYDYRPDVGTGWKLKCVELFGTAVAL